MDTPMAWAVSLRFRQIRSCPPFPSTHLQIPSESSGVHSLNPAGASGSLMIRASREPYFPSRYASSSLGSVITA